MKQNILTIGTLLAAFMFCTAFVSDVSAQDAKKAKVLHFTRSQGFEHDPAKLLEDGTTVSGRALKKYFDENGKNIEVVETQDGTVFDGDLSSFDAFVFYSSGNLEDPNGSKNDKAKAISAEGLQKLIAAVKDGKGFVAIHSGTDTHCRQKAEDGTDLFTKFVGARFTGHGPQQFATAIVTEPAELPCLKESGKRFTTWEEWYAMGQYNTDMHVLLIQETAEMEGDCYNRPPFPLSWVRKEGKGRVAYSPFGHDNRYWRVSENVRRVAELVEWSVGRFEMDTTPNFDKVTPKGNEMPPKK